jgi:ABC-2 type transport system permease protein
MSHAARVPVAIAAMTAMEFRLSLRRGETLLATAVLPVVVLIFFSSAPILSIPGERAVDFLLPGSIAFGIIATSLVSLGITTAYDRHYGVLKRLGGSPLSRAEVLVAKLAVVLVVEAVQVALLVGFAIVVLGWALPTTAWVAGATAAILLGTLAFAGLGLMLAGILRAEAMLAVANALFLASLVLGGVIVPIDRLPAPLGVIAAALPAAALTEALRSALASEPTPTSQLALLALWGAASVIVAVRTFRWE